MKTTNTKTTILVIINLVVFASALLDVTGKVKIGPADGKVKIGVGKIFKQTVHSGTCYLAIGRFLTERVRSKCADFSLNSTAISENFKEQYAELKSTKVKKVLTPEVIRQSITYHGI